jgi:hypothetical protein
MPRARSSARGRPGRGYAAEVADTATSVAARNRAVVGVLLALGGVLLWVLSALASGHEARSDTSGGAPPEQVVLTAGRTYWISVKGGVDVVPNGISSGLSCTLTQAGAPQRLSVSPYTDGKSITQIASFTSPVSGSAHVACTGLPAVYIDDADGSFDLRMLLIVLAATALAVGLPLALSGWLGVVNADREPVTV